MIALDHVDRTFVNFRQHPFPDPRAHAFRWVDRKSFRFPPGTRHRDLLAALVAHEQFRDDYAGGGVDPDGLRHGPYWIRCVSPDAYEQVAPAEARRVLQHWADQYDPCPESLERALDEAVFSAIDAADGCYRLPDLGDRAFHDWGGVHGEFHEYVAVDDERGRLALLVAADD